MTMTFGFFDACVVIPGAYPFLAKILIMISVGKSVDPNNRLAQAKFYELV
jgi:hypothetical protein